MRNKSLYIFKGAAVGTLILLIIVVGTTARIYSQDEIINPEPVTSSAVGVATAEDTFSEETSSHELPLIVYKTAQDKEAFLPLIFKVLLTPVEQEVLDLVNIERAKVGCNPLTADQRLITAARLHNTDMATNNFFDHTGSDGSSPGDRIDAQGYEWRGWGENIAAGQTSPSSVMNSWMNSSGHRANILNCSYEDIGIGHLIAPGSIYGTYWTQVFATPR